MGEPTDRPEHPSSDDTERAADASQPPRPGARGPLKRLYDWVLSWANTPYGTWALFFLAFAESSFFPVPPDVLLIALALGASRRAFWLAAVCTVGSVLGGGFGYLLGWLARDAIALPIVDFYGARATFDMLVTKFDENSIPAIALAAMTPLPYKVFTIAAGVAQVSFPVFIVVSLIFRGLRFFLVAGLIYKFGPPVKGFIDRWFNLLVIALAALGIAGFVVIKYVI